MEHQAAEWTLNLDVGTDRHDAEHSLESRVAHPGRNEERIFIGGTCDGKRASIPFPVRFRWIDERHIYELAGLERKAVRFLKLKGHCPFCHLTAVF
jgi:hypothetical protein